MTRHFSNQRRDRMRPSSHQSASGRSSENRTSQSAQPRTRLSRDTVDRAWENGATRTHADYNPRQNMQRPPFQRQSPPARSTQQPGRAPYGNRPSEPGRTPYGNRPSEPGRALSYDRRPYAPRPYSPNSRPGYQGPRESAPDGFRAQRTDNRPYPGRGSSERPGFNRAPRAPYQQGRDSERYSERPSPPFRQDNYRPQYRPQRQGYSSDGAPRDFERPEREEPRAYRSSRPFRQPEQQGYRAERGPRESQRRNFARDDRPGASREQGEPDRFNPRWQSRPAAQRVYGNAPSPRRHDEGYRQSAQERFEGDYESFTVENEPAQPEGRTFEPRVTRMPDGRVLKGSRPAQRKQEKFWNEVAGEAATLVPKNPATIPEAPREPETVQEPEPSDEVAPKIASPRPARAAKPKTEKTPRGKTKAVKTVKTTRSEGAAKKSRKEKTRKTQAAEASGPAMRPSQRGFTWPTSSEE